MRNIEKVFFVSTKFIRDKIFGGVLESEHILQWVYLFLPEKHFWQNVFQDLWFKRFYLLYNYFCVKILSYIESASSTTIVLFFSFF